MARTLRSRGTAMGIIKKVLKLGFYTATGGLGAGAAYVASSTTLVDLARDDPFFRSKAYTRYNPRDNPALQDVVIKRLPLRSVRPELRDNESALALEFCRGVWGRWGYYLQSKMQERWDKPPGSEEDNLWDVKELAVARFEPGLRFSNHFEVVDNRGNEIYVRCGGSPMSAPGLRASDGLIVLGARIDRDAQQAELYFKSALYDSSATKTKGAAIVHHPIPPKIIPLHRWYVRVLTLSGAANVQA